MQITRIVETHLHNDYVSGGLVLARMTAASCVHAAAEDLRFDHLGVADGDRFTVGDLTVDVLATPGHTPHHLSYLVRHGTSPAALFSGGSLLYGTVGRTDLIGADQTETLTRLQYRSAHRLAALPDNTRIYPTHGFGSFCASATADQPTDGSLASERDVNLALIADNEDDFVRQLLAGLDAYPAYYAHMGPLNQAGPLPIDLSPPAPVDPTELSRRLHRGDWVVDLRQRRLYAAGHVAGTINIELGDSFATYLGWLIPWGTPLTLLAETAEQITDAQRQLVRIGIDRPSGAAVGPPQQWSSPDACRSYPAVDFDTAAQQLDGVILDVRRHDERAQSAIHGSWHIPIHDLVSRHHELPDTTLWVHCASGVRASIAASLLERAGRHVVLIDDDFTNAQPAGFRLTHPT